MTQSPADLRTHFEKVVEISIRAGMEPPDLDADTWGQAAAPQWHTGRAAHLPLTQRADPAGDSRLVALDRSPDP
jgi:hypothetical protein